MCEKEKELLEVMLNSMALLIVMLSQMYTYLKTHQEVKLNMYNFFVYQLDLNN